jgi:RNA polymerase sigma factor (sigma-70 family)
MDAEDAALLAAVCEGSERAFNQLVDRHQQAVRHFLRRVVGRNDADDVAQETFLWLFGIAWRKAKDTQRTWFRRRQRDAVWRESADEHSDNPGEVQYALQQALVSLSPDQRAAVMLCLGYGLTNEEAAEALRMPLGTVKSHVLRGRDRLQNLLGEVP